MSNRYHSRNTDSDPRPTSGREDLFGEGWIGLGAIAVALITVAALTGSAGHGLGRDRVDTSQAILATVEPAERSLAAVESAFSALCQEPVLIGLELEPDCETGVVTLPDSYFTSHANPRIRSQFVGVSVYYGPTVISPPTRIRASGSKRASTSRPR